MTMMMKTKTIDRITIVCCFVTGLFCMNHIASDLKDGRECKIELDQEQALRMQAEDIELKLIDERADDWCSDSIDHAYEALELCEEDGFTDVYYPSECAPCWNAWTMDMGSSCNEMFDNRRDAVEDTIFMQSTIDIWTNYVDARIADCESRILKTRAQRETCMGPAAHPEQFMKALESMSIYQESRMRDGYGYL